MEDAPDVTALELPAAEEALAAAGWRVQSTVATRPPAGGDGAGVPRVLRQRVVGRREVELVIAHPRYERGACVGRVRD